MGNYTVPEIYVELGKILVKKEFKNPIKMINFTKDSIEFYISPPAVQVPQVVQASPAFQEKEEDFIDFVCISNLAFENIEESLSTVYGSKIVGIKEEGNKIKVKTKEKEFYKRYDELVRDILDGAYLRARYLCGLYGIDTYFLEELQNSSPLEAAEFLSNLEQKLKETEPYLKSSKWKLEIKRNAFGRLEVDSWLE